MTSAPLSPERLQEELEQHLDDAVYDAMHRGESANTARAQATARFGNMRAIRFAAQRSLLMADAKALAVEALFAILMCTAAYSMLYYAITYPWVTPWIVLIVFIATSILHIVVLRPLWRTPLLAGITVLAPLVALTAMGLAKDAVDVITEPRYATNTAHFLMQMLILTAIVSAAFLAQYHVRRIMATQSLLRQLLVKNMFRLLPAVYFLGTTLYLVVTGTGLDIMVDNALMWPRSAIDLPVLATISRIHWSTTGGGMVVVGIGVALFAVALLATLVVRIGRVYRNEQRLAVLEMTVAAYVLSLLPLLFFMAW